MASARDFNEAIARLKVKYPHRSEDIDFLLAHMPESKDSAEWLLSVEQVIRRDEKKEK